MSLGPATGPCSSVVNTELEMGWGGDNLAFGEGGGGRTLQEQLLLGVQ